MSGLMNKVKAAVSGDKHTPEAEAAHQGTNEYGHTPSSNLTHGGINHSATSADRTGHAGYGTDSNTAGPHSSNVGNTLDPRVDSDRGKSMPVWDQAQANGDLQTAAIAMLMVPQALDLLVATILVQSGSGYGSTGYDNTSGPHSSNLANKADPRIDSDRDGSRGFGSSTGTTGGYGSSNTTAGPHSSNLANKTDPRVDSDRDGSNRHGTTSGLTGSNTSGTGYGSSGYDSTNTGSGLTGSGSGSGLTGHGHHGHHGGVSGKVDDLVHGGEHHTETANRLDPHVSGGRGPLEHTTVGGSGSGLGGSTGSSGYGSSNTTAGPHSSNLGNKADPRVDSDLDGSRGLGSSTHQSGYGSSTGTTGGYGSSNTTAGPHSSNLGNKADPRVDSDRDGSRGLGSSTHQPGYGSSTGTTGGYGSSNTTAGPHSSNLGNKADPRVDSDLDGSRGYGSSTGHSGTHTGTGYGNTTGTSGTHTGTGYGDNTTGTTGKKPGLMDRLNPMKDTDGDGKKGMME
ncbi:MAG: hypothetical protein Q9200_003624 [Gallowayella weberi]